MAMTAYEAADRLSAPGALRLAQEIKVKDESRGTIVLKSGHKRPWED